MRRLDPAVIHRRWLQYLRLRRSGVVEASEAGLPVRSGTFQTTDFFEHTRWEDGWEFEHDFTARGFWDIALQLADVLAQHPARTALAARWPRRRGHDAAGATARTHLQGADATDRVLDWAHTFIHHPLSIAQALAHDETERRAALRLLDGRRALTQAAWVTAVLTHPVWARPLSSLRPVCAGDSFLERLLGRLPVADVIRLWLNESIGSLSDVWYRPYRQAGAALPLVWFVSRSQGASLTRVTRELGWWPLRPSMIDAVEGRDGYGDRDLDSRSVGAMSLLAAAVAAGGGREVEFRRLRDAAVTVDYDAQARFAVATTRWLARHRADLGDEEAVSIGAWALHCELEGQRDGQAGFSWRGRTPASALRAALAYEAQWNAQPAERLSWAEQGWNAEVVDASAGGAPWLIRELLTSDELAQEGAAQGHCVGSYADRCVRGESAIFQLSRNGERVATVEVSPPRRQIVQVRGRFNAPVPGSVEAVLRLWSDETGLGWAAP